MTGFYDITTHIKNILEANPSNPSVNTGEISEVLLKKQDMYPYSHIIVNNVLNDGNEGNILTWNISLICMDIVDISKEHTTELFLGNNDVQDILNTQLSIIMRTIEILRRGQDTRTYQLDGSVNIEPFTDRFEHGVAGWTATFDVSMPNTMTVCDEDLPAGVCANATAVLNNTLDELISSTSIASGVSAIIVAPDGSYTVQYENGTPITSGTVASDGSVIIEIPNPEPCADATVNVNGVFLTDVPSGDTENVEVLQSSGIVAVGTIDTGVVRVADSDLTLNGGAFLSVKAEDSQDIELLDQDDVAIVPLSVVGNVVKVDIPVASTPIGATLIKTGQTTSYRTGDDGDLEAGRATDFLTLASNNPFGNTNRFTDELGGSTYTNNIVIDWSTYDGSTVTGWYKKDFVTLVLETWANAIDNALSLTVATFSAWRIPNIRELNNIMNYSHGNVFNYVPFNNTLLTVTWSSTTDPAGSGSHAIIRSGITSNSRNKTLTSYSIRCRTFTVTGTTLS